MSNFSPKSNLTYKVVSLFGCSESDFIVDHGNWQVLSSRSYYHIFGLVLTETGKEENGLFTFKVNESMKARILHTQKKF